MMNLDDLNPYPTWREGTEGGLPGDCRGGDGRAEDHHLQGANGQR